MAAFEHRGSVSQQAAADVAQMIRGKRWLQRVVEVAEAATARAGDPASGPRSPRPRQV